MFLEVNVSLQVIRQSGIRAVIAHESFSSAVTVITNKGVWNSDQLLARLSNPSLSGKLRWDFQKYEVIRVVEFLSFLYFFLTHVHL